MATLQAALATAYESWNAGDLDGYLSLYVEGIALHGYSPRAHEQGPGPRLLPGDIQRL